MSKSWRYGRAALAVATAMVAGTLAFVAPARAAVTSYGGDQLGTGWYPSATGLSPALVGSGNFGQQFSAPVEGSVYAQPLVSDHTLLVATEDNDVYGLDPGSGAQRWTRNLGVPWNPADIGCGDLTPTVGVTGTPVVDPSTDTMYLFSKTYASGTSGPAAYYAQAIDIATGAERPHFPVLISGTAANDPGRSFDPTLQLQRPGLLLLGGVVYAAFGGHCDDGNYAGWVVGVSGAGPITTMWSDETGAGASAGIWQSGGALVSDGAGQILLTSGNGTVASQPTPGKTPPGDLGNAVVRLAVQPDGALRATDFFAPYDAASLNGWDADLGSGAPTGLSARFGTAAHPHLMVVVGKEGYIYLLDRDHLGGMGEGPAGGDAVVYRSGSDGGVWGKAAAWPGDGGYVYLTTVSSGSTNYGTTGFLHVYKYIVDASGTPKLALAGKAVGAFGFSSSPAVVTSSGTKSGTALVWVVYAPSGSGTGAQLRAYDPVPSDGTLRLVHSWPIGTSSKFAPPAVDGSKVYVGTRDGHVLGFGSPIAAPLDGQPVNWPATPVGQSAARTATFTANAAMTVTGVTTSSSEFAAGAPSPSLPAALAAGERFTVPVTYTPAASGPSSAALTVSTTAGTASVALTGTGEAASGQISASPTAVSFGGVDVGSSSSSSITVSNTGAQAVTVEGVHMPTGPFTVTGLPSPGAVIAAASSLHATATFAPSATGTFVSSVSISTSAGSVSVPMSGSAGVGPRLAVTPAALSFGAVPVGGQASESFTLSNTGGAALRITSSAPPAQGSQFAATTTLTAGYTIAPGASVTEDVTYAPNATGAASSSWVIVANDGAGPHSVALGGRGVTGSSIPAPSAGGWTLNGTSVLIGSRLQLTNAVAANQAGSAFWPAELTTGYLDVSFDASIGGGSGADGMTLALADPAAGATPTSLGADGGGLGWSTIPGIAVALDTYANGTDPSSNFLGVATGYSSADNHNLVWQATTTAVPPLRGVVRHVRVIVADATLTAFVDGKQVLATPVTLAGKYLVGFTGGTGALTDRHDISNVTITTA